MVKKIVYILIILVIAIGCQRTKPQSPSNRRNTSKQDSASVALVLVNQQLAEQADMAVLDYVKNHHTDEYTLVPNGYWKRKLRRTDERTIKDGEELEISIVIWELTAEKKLLLNSSELRQINQAEMIVPIWETLTEMHLGESSELIVPWYAAYGSTGNEIVKPYTNLIIEIVCH